MITKGSWSQQGIKTSTGTHLSEGLGATVGHRWRAHGEAGPAGEAVLTRRCLLLPGGAESHGGPVWRTPQRGPLEGYLFTTPLPALVAFVLGV